MPDGSTVQSDADGRFVLRDLNPSEKIDLHARLEGYVPAFAPGVRGPSEQPVRLVLARGATVRGRVLDQNGDVVARAAVVGLEVASSFPNNTRVDDEGAFSFSALAPGAWQFEATAPGYEKVDDVPVRVDLDAGEVETDLRLVLRELEHGEVNGRVVDEERKSGSPTHRSRYPSPAPAPPPAPGESSTSIAYPSARARSSRWRRTGEPRPRRSTCGKASTPSSSCSRAASR
jgi:hypothetical protein